MEYVIGFVVGVFVGGCAGALFMGLLIAGREEYRLHHG